MNSDCTHWQGSIAAYVDGELPADARQAFRLHAQSCAACAMQALAAAEAKLAIRSAGQRYNAPPELRSRVAQLIAGGGAPRVAIAAQGGDSVFQPRKVDRSGLFEAVEGRVLIYVHKEEELNDVQRRCPAKHYVLVDDKLNLPKRLPAETTDEWVMLKRERQTRR